MRRLFPSIIALLMVAGTLPAQTTDSPSTTKKDREPVGINLSLWKNMSTQQTDTVGSTCLNLGLFSSMNRLNGVGINLLGHYYHFQAPAWDEGYVSDSFSANARWQIQKRNQ